MSLNKMKILFLLLTSLWLSAVSGATVIPNELGAPTAGGLPRESSLDYEITYGSVRVGEELQRVIVTVPPGAGAKPALLFIGGMGCYSVDFSGGNSIASYQIAIELATRAGFVTMRVEKSGMGDSKGTACQDQDFQRELQGNLAGLQALVKYPFVKADQIYIFGHSIGGVIAPYLASQVPVKSIAVMGTLAGNWYDYTLINTERQLALAGLNPMQIFHEMKKARAATDMLLKQKMSPAAIIQQYPELANYVTSPVSYTYMQQLADLDVEGELLKSNSKYLILSGESDFVASQYDELMAMAARLNPKRSTPIEVLQIPQLDHFFMNANSQQESFNQKHIDGSPLYLQNSIYSVLKVNFLL
ncbi:alpha/beta hydrolase [Bdellovibrio sp. HCB337]|uniref:alpha/beta hydrolase n=1 Tax=Bdellovibrio sp. HCB337 TaxID=3394358 RepID=UPI0039A44DA9